MCNLVLHHIEDEETRNAGFSRTATVLKEVARVLRPGGTYCMNHITPEQVDTYVGLAATRHPPLCHRHPPDQPYYHRRSKVLVPALCTRVP